MKMHKNNTTNPFAESEQDNSQRLKQKIKFYSFCEAALVVLLCSFSFFLFKVLFW